MICQRYILKQSRKRKAIATVITTMIILVSSVVLGSGVVIYGTSLFQTNAQSETISTQGLKLWVNATDAKGTSWGSVAVRNTGDKLEAVDNIGVRGVIVPYANWYYANTTNSLANIQDQFVYGSNDGKGMLKTYRGPAGSTPSTDTCTPTAAIQIDTDGNVGKPMICLGPSNGPISLKPGESVVIYFHLPNGVLSTVDSGSATTVALYAGKVGAPIPVTVANP